MEKLGVEGVDVLPESIFKKGVLPIIKCKFGHYTHRFRHSAHTPRVLHGGSITNDHDNDNNTDLSVSRPEDDSGTHLNPVQSKGETRSKRGRHVPKITGDGAEGVLYQRVSSSLPTTRSKGSRGDPLPLTAPPRGPTDAGSLLGTVRNKKHGKKR